MPSVTMLRSGVSQSAPASIWAGRGARAAVHSARAGRVERPRGHARRLVAMWLAMASPMAAGAPAPVQAVADEHTLFSEIPSVFAASRFEQSTTDAPADVTVVTAADIDRYGYRTLADVLQSVRGFAVSNDYNYAYVAARGFGLAGDYNTRVLLLLDGHRLNDNVYDQALLGQEGVIDLALVERIEVVRGPGSSLYGSNALFAVINVITRRGRDLQGATVRVEASQHGGAAASATAGQRLPGGTEYLVGVASGRDPGEKRLYFPEFARTSSGGFAIDADTDRWRRAFARVRHDDLEISAGFSNRLKTIPTASFGTTFDDSRTQTLDERSFVRANYAHAPNTDTRWELRASIDEYRFAGDYFQDIPSTLVTRDRVLSRWIALGAEGSQRLGAHHVVAGVEWERDVLTSITSTDLYADGRALRYADIHDGSAHQGAYAQDEWRLAEGLLASLGLRYDRYRGFPGEASPRVALVWQATPATTLKLLYSHAYRVPNLNELYYFDGLSTRASPGLHPERIRATELVLAQRFGAGLRATANLYRYRISGLITQDETRDDYLIFANNRDLTMTGGSIGLEGQFAQGAEWKLSVGRDAQSAGHVDQELNLAARRQAKAGLSAPLGDTVHVAVEALYEGPRHTLEGRPLGGQTLTNLALTLGGLPAGLRARLAAHNALDRRLVVPATPGMTQDVLVAPRRTLWLTLEATLP